MVQQVYIHPSTIMPDPKPVNREAVKVLAKAIGVREAARRMGLSEQRVMKWSQRDPEGPWGPPAEPLISRSQATQAGIARKRQLLPGATCPQPTVSAPDAMSAVLAEHEGATRIAFAKAARKGAEHAAQSTGDEVVAMAGDLKSLAGVALVAHRFGEDTADKRKASSLMVNIGLVLSGQPLGTLEIEAQMAGNGQEQAIECPVSARVISEDNG